MPDYMIKLFLALAYPSVVCREVMVPLLSHLGWIFSTWAFFLGYGPCTSLYFKFIFWLCCILYLV